MQTLLLRLLLAADVAPAAARPVGAHRPRPSPARCGPPGGWGARRRRRPRLGAAGGPVAYPPHQPPPPAPRVCVGPLGRGRGAPESLRRSQSDPYDTRKPRAVLRYGGEAGPAMQGLVL